MKPLIKICGIADFNFLNEVIQINEINYLGFIFYENSPRNVTQDLLNDIKRFDFKDKRPVCVFVNASSEFIQESISYFKDPLLQFHGDETNQFCSSFQKDFWKVIHVKSIESIDRIIYVTTIEFITFQLKNNIVFCLEKFLYSVFLLILH